MALLSQGFVKFALYFMFCVYLIIVCAKSNIQKQSKMLKWVLVIFAPFHYCAEWTLLQIAKWKRHLLQQNHNVDEFQKWNKCYLVWYFFPQDWLVAEVVGTKADLIIYQKVLKIWRSEWMMVIWHLLWVCLYKIRCWVRMSEESFFPLPEIPGHLILLEK